MEPTPAFKRDAVDEFLDATFPAAANAQLQQALLLQTMRLLRRRQRYKQLSFVAALVVCYAAGLGTMWLWTSSAAATDSTEMVRLPVGPLEDGGIPRPPDASEPAPELLPLEKDPEAPAIVFERVAAASSAEQRSIFYRHAGDHYLEIDSDVESALRCYARALDTASEGDLTISAHDNWLLIFLKKARQVEKNHAQKTG